LANRRGIAAAGAGYRCPTRSAGAGYPLQWTPNVKFADDPLLSTRDREESDSLGAGFADVCEPKRSDDGTWRCTIRLRLQRETNYPAQYRDDPRTRR
jgi:hypothetical protein